jgi:hypothetical protein
LDQGKLNEGRNIAYAAGLMVLHYRGLNEISHSGTTAGYNVWLGRYPEQNLSVAVLCNSNAANGTQLGHTVADIFLGAAKADPPRMTQPAMAGLYRSLRDNSTIEVGAGSRNEFVGDRMRIPSEMGGARGAPGRIHGCGAGDRGPEAGLHNVSLELVVLSSAPP